MKASRADNCCTTEIAAWHPLDATNVRLCRSYLRQPTANDSMSQYLSICSLCINSGSVGAGALNKRLVYVYRTMQNELCKGKAISKLI